jgi:hypothetical protein
MNKNEPIKDESEEFEDKLSVDEYGEVINSEKTYKGIAKRLKLGRSVLIGWTDENATHFDILFAYQVNSIVGQALNGVFVGDHFLSSNFQGGIRPSDLFVSIMRVGCFGFEIENTNTDWGYYSEKLGSRGSLGETTGKKIAELINGIKKELWAES